MKIDTLAEIDPGQNDNAIAQQIADYVLAEQRFGGPGLRLAVMHDGATGPCLLPHDWQNKNMLGIIAHDRNTATRWVIKALLLGYSVSRGYFSTCTIAMERARAHEQNRSLR